MTMLSKELLLHKTILKKIKKYQLLSSTVDTFLFFSISFYATGVPWITLSLGDLAVKLFVSLVMLIPFRILLKISKPI